MRHGIHRNTRKRESESTSPFPCPSRGQAPARGVGSFRGYAFVMIFLAVVIVGRLCGPTARDRDGRGWLACSSPAMILVNGFQVRNDHRDQLLRFVIPRTPPPSTSPSADQAQVVDVKPEDQGAVWLGLDDLARVPLLLGDEPGRSRDRNSFERGARL